MDNIVETFITIAFIAIAFISWVIRLVGQSGEEAKAQARQQQQRRERPARLAPRPADRATNSRQAAASEIDSFLRQATTAPAKPAEEEIEIEVVPDEELRERDARGRESQSRADMAETPGQRTEWDRQYESRRDRLHSAIAERHLDTTAIGTELRRHAEQTMAEAAAIASQRDDAERELADTRARIRTLEGSAAATADAVAELSGARTSDVAALLRNPATVKNAIVINEILGRPRGLSRSAFPG